MVPAKLLVGGTVAVGSTATAVVVANQYGLFSASKTVGAQEEQIEDVAKLVEKLKEGIEQEIKISREKITKWFDDNIGKSKWKVRIKEADETGGKDIAESDPRGLSDYLDKKIELLTSLASSDIVTTFTFEYYDYEDDDEDLEDLSTKEKIVKWIENSFRDGAALQTEKLSTLSDEKSEELLKILKEDENLSTNLKGKTERNWENILTKEQVLAWVKNTSGDRATLKVEKLSSLKKGELEALLKALENNKGLFTNLGSATTDNKKTILFEGSESNWSHTKTVIKKWEEDNNFEVKIGKDKSNSKTLDEMDEKDLVGLMGYYGSYEIQGKSYTYKNPKEKVTWIFEKEGTKWKAIYGQNTINYWIDNVSDKKAKLELYDKSGSKKELSTITAEDELKRVFDGITGENRPFKEGLESYEENNKKTVVFEEYNLCTKIRRKDGKVDSTCNESWMHIKDAIRRLVADITDECSECKLKLGEIKIQVDGDAKKEKGIGEAKDDELIGLLQHIQKNKETYKTEAELTLKKDATNGWQKA